jgi:hypothetical protein
VAVSALGFGQAGVVAGSTAAGIQSGIGLVQAGSWFAYGQSLGALGGGIFGAAFWPVTIGVGLTCGGVCLYKKLSKK